MVGQFGQVRPQVGGIDGLERLPDAAVQAHPAGGGQTLIQHLADQRVREPPAAKPTWDRPDHPRRLGLFQQFPKWVGVQAAGWLQHAQLEVATQHGSDLEHPPAAVGETAEPSRISSSGRRAPAARRKLARLSNSWKRAASGSMGGGVGRPGRWSRTAGTTWAMSAAPAPISSRSAAGSLAWT
jgi:hypothetical protein